MANTIRRMSIQIVSNSNFSRLLTLALAVAGALIINAPIGGGGGGY
jgi:hypothetical protein